MHREEEGPSWYLIGGGFQGAFYYESGGPGTEGCTIVRAKCSAIAQKFSSFSTRCYVTLSASGPYFLIVSMCYGATECVAHFCATICPATEFFTLELRNKRDKKTSLSVSELY